MFAIFRKKPSSIKRLQISPPTPRADRQGVAISVCVKNEGRYIAEWIRFHRAIGIRHFIIYDNGSTDNTCEIVRSELSSAHLTIVPWNGRVAATKPNRFIDGQVLAFAHAIQNFGDRFSHMAFIDVDEFLVPKVGSTIDEALRSCGHFPNISLPWHMFGTSGRKTAPSGGVVMNYVMRSADLVGKGEPSFNFKCIVDPCEVTEVAVHHFQTRTHGDVTSNDVGRKSTRRERKEPDFFSNSAIQLNHYYSKSEAEMLEKLARGSNYATSSTVLAEKMRETLRIIEEDEIEDSAVIDFIQAHNIDLDRPFEPEDLHAQ
ncbi:glycosyltransferase family 92 protein [Neorhizobium sp. NPDC001467]|uniref:glycosyltransferase family 92 protein n=1 Tax=Neorhizobium sp. NPDC001467 TaxID=3390595 RepID=UPI003D0305F8